MGVAGLVVAAALAAIMSTSSGALIATATVAKEDIVGTAPAAAGTPVPTPVAAGGEHLTPAAGARRGRPAAVGTSWLSASWSIAIACVLGDVVAALTIAYDILVGGLLVAIIGGMIWKRGTIAGALVSIATGTVLTLGTMAVVGDIYANEPIFAGLIGSLSRSSRSAWPPGRPRRRSAPSGTAGSTTSARRPPSRRRRPPETSLRTTSSHTLTHERDAQQ